MTEKSLDPSQDNKVLSRFCEHLSTHLCVLELVLLSNRLSDKSFEPGMDDPMILPIDDEKISRKLRECNYISLLQQVLGKLEIHEKAFDIFRPQLDDRLFDTFKNVIKQQQREFRINVHPRGYIYHCPALISDAILPAISSFHSEVVLTFQQFMETIDAVGGKAERIFLNAKGSTAKSQFIQMWAAHHLGFSSGNYGGSVLVV